MKKLFFSCFIVMLISVSGAMGAGPAQTMRDASAAWSQGDKERAILLWEGLLANEYASAPLHYNLGAAYYEQGDLGKAVLHYERALLLQPGNKRVRRNLSLVNRQVEGEPIGWPVFMPIQLWGRIRGILSANVWAVLGLVFSWAALAGWRLGRPWRLAAAIAAPLAIFAWLFSWSASRALSSPYAIVQEKELLVQVGPDMQSGRVATVYAGWKLLRLDQIGDWVKVELPTGEEGWVSKETIVNL
jgi:tetratricopeptide (TPR) repeat protein